MAAAYLKLAGTDGALLAASGGDIACPPPAASQNGRKVAAVLGPRRQRERAELGQLSPAGRASRAQLREGDGRAHGRRASSQTPPIRAAGVSVTGLFGERAGGQCNGQGEAEAAMPLVVVWTSNSAAPARRFSN